MRRVEFEGLDSCCVSSRLCGLGQCTTPLRVSVFPMDGGDLT